MQRIGELGEALFAALARGLDGSEGRVAVPAEIWAGEVEERWFALDTALDVLGSRLDLAAHADDDGAPAFAEPEALLALQRRCQSLRDDLASIARGIPGRIAWFESAARSRRLSASPVELSELLQSRLFDVTPYDAPTYAVVLGLLAAVAALASYIPARHAGHVEPLLALRHE